MESSDLTTNQEKKTQKKKDYRNIRIPIGVSAAELTKLVELAQKAGYCPKTQKGVQTRKDSGSPFYNVKGISQFIRDVVIPDYAAHSWEREQKKADAIRDVQLSLEKAKEAGIDLKKLNGLV